MPFQVHFLYQYPKLVTALSLFVINLVNCGQEAKGMTTLLGSPTPSCHKGTYVINSCTIEYLF